MLKTNYEQLKLAIDVENLKSFQFEKMSKIKEMLDYALIDKTALK